MYTILSKTFEIIGITDIGLQLLGSDLLPFLKSGVTLAVFQSFGYIPVRKDFEKIEVREGATVLEAIFNNLLGIIPRPVAFVSSISGLSRHVRLDSSYNMKMVRNSRNL